MEMRPLQSHYLSASIAPFSIISKSFGQFQSHLTAWKRSQRCEAQIISMILIEFRCHNTSPFWGYGHRTHTTILLDTRASTRARPVRAAWSARRALRWAPHSMTSAWRTITQDGPGSRVLLPSHALTCCGTLGKSKHPSYPRFSACKLGVLSALKGVNKGLELSGRKERTWTGRLFTSRSLGVAFDLSGDS